VKVKLENLSGSLQKKRLSLLETYDAEDLHQLRVGLRRMRSHLKSRSGSKARSLRHQLGTLADAYDPETDVEKLKAVRDWCRDIETEGERCLEATKAGFQSAELAHLQGVAETGD